MQWIAGYRLHIDDDNDKYEDDDDDDDDVPPDNMEGVVGVKGAVGSALKMGFLQN